MFLRFTLLLFVFMSSLTAYSSSISLDDTLNASTKESLADCIKKRQSLLSPRQAAELEINYKMTFGMLYMKNKERGMGDLLAENEAYKSFNGKSYRHLENAVNSILRQYPLGKAAYTQEVEKREKGILQERSQLIPKKLLP